MWKAQKPSASHITTAPAPTDEQAQQAQNLPTQKRKVEERCRRDGLPVLKM
ncbi:MAG: hypothetical protein WBY96_18610 [Candidatus Sulfotelmatobacter sp.]